MLDLITWVAEKQISMSFPIGPDPRTGEPDTLFQVQDPFGLRRSVTPVFVRDFSDGMFYGCGTSFFVTPFGQQLSAMHIVTDFLQQRGLSVRPNMTTIHDSSNAWIQILFDPGLVYGTRPAGKTLPVSMMAMFPRDQSAHPLAITFTREQLERVEPALDLISWQIGGISTNEKTEFLPVRIGRGPFVRPSDRVLALGYPINNSTLLPGRTMATYVERMFASIATILEVHHDWNQERGIWPEIVVGQRWPPGMSGGPVITEAGEVIGIVSRGGEDWSRALWLQRLPFDEKVFPGLDDGNPGWVKGWGVCTSRSLLDLFPTREAAERKARELGIGLEVRRVSTPLGCQRLNNARSRQHGNTSIDFMYLS